jgi:hypothetical protein
VGGVMRAVEVGLSIPLSGKRLERGQYTAPPWTV